MVLAIRAGGSDVRVTLGTASVPGTKVIPLNSCHNYVLYVFLSAFKISDFQPHHGGGKFVKDGIIKLESHPVIK